MGLSSSADRDRLWRTRLRIYAAASRRRIAEGRDDETQAWIFAQEWRALQRPHRLDGVLRPIRSAWRRHHSVSDFGGCRSDKVIAAIAKLSERPIQFIVNTSMHAEHVGGTAKLGAAGADPSLPGSFFDLQLPAGATGLLNDPAHHAPVIAQNKLPSVWKQPKHPRHDSSRYIP